MISNDESKLTFRAIDQILDKSLNYPAPLIV